MQLLIVDDSPAMRSFIRRVLDLCGLECGSCLEANDGQEALAVLQNNPVDLVLTDINMPRMDGEELLRRMASDASLYRIPVVIVSTDRTEARKEKMITLGARGYVSKPFTPERMRDALENILDHQGASPQGGSNGPQ